MRKAFGALDQDGDGVIATGDLLDAIEQATTESGCAQLPTRPRPRAPTRPALALALLFESLSHLRCLFTVSLIACLTCVCGVVVHRCVQRRDGARDD